MANQQRGSRVRISAIFLLAVCSLAQSQPPSPTPTGAGQERQKSTTEVQDPAKYHEDKSSTDWWMRIFTGLIFLATAVQAYIYWRQKQLMRNALAETKKAADAATKSAEVADKALVHTQRAFVHLEEFRTETVFMETALSGGSKQIIGWRIHLQWRNMGNTPALNVKSVVGNRRFRSGQPLELTPLPEDEAKLSAAVGITLGPHTGMHGIPMNFTVAAVQQIESGEVVVFVYGSVEYIDIFEGTPKRHTGVWARITASGEDLTKTHRPFDYTSEGPHNYAD